MRFALAPNPLLIQGDYLGRNGMKCPSCYPAPLVAERPTGLTKEPTYKGKPLYGKLTLGNGVKKDFPIVFDDAALAVYIDTNQNGDLTDDLPFGWISAEKQPDGTVQLIGNFILEVAFELGKGVQNRAPLCVSVFRQRGANEYFSTILNVRSGRVALQGKTYNVMAASMDATGAFIVDPSNPDKDLSAVMHIDFSNDGNFACMNYAEAFGMGEPQEILGQWVKFDANADGSLVTMHTCAAPPPDKVQRLPLKQSGEKAPDFTLQKPDGSTVHLSDFKGKTVVIDFWAAWCGPCQAALPKVEALWRKVKSDPKVIFLGLCVADEKSSFDSSIQEKAANFSFTLGWDPAGRTKEGKDQMHLWGITGIPHTWVVSPDGTILESLSGFSEDNEARLVKCLEAQGIKVS